MFRTGKLLRPREAEGGLRKCPIPTLTRRSIRQILVTRTLRASNIGTKKLTNLWLMPVQVILRRWKTITKGLLGAGTRRRRRQRHVPLSQMKTCPSVDPSLSTKDPRLTHTCLNLQETSPFWDLQTTIVRYRKTIISWAEELFWSEQLKTQKTANTPKIILSTSQASRSFPSRAVRSVKNRVEICWL